MVSARIAVIGAGRMGTAIAYVFSAAGHDVAVQDVNPESLARLGAEFRRIAALRREATPVTPRAHDDLAAAVRGADFVIEAAAENPETKREIFQVASEFAPGHALLSTNSSSITISEIVGSVDGRARVLGTHFWNPPYAIPLVEVSQAATTDDRCVERAVQILSGAGMRPVRVRRDIPGLVGNRLQHALKREAIALVAAGVCDAETIDTVSKIGFGSRMAVLGPLEQSDLVGLDLTLEIHRALMPTLDNTATVHPLLAQKVAAGQTGMNAGVGFRTWTPESADEVRRRLDDYLVSMAAEAAAHRGPGQAEKGDVS
jgi:3-hydroxybutyryl-CoA dehydrogenase